jgi:hypothetical protein
MVHLPPDPHVLASFANQNLPWWKALAELVDNSLDAGATRVVIDVTNRVLTVSDDGSGCEDITAVFKLGDHKRRKSSKRSLGRYGIGAKDAWLSCADAMEVLSYRGGFETKMRINYKEWASNDWNTPDPVSMASEKPTGTIIRLPLRHGKNIPSEDAFGSLEFAFTPAISRGIQIVKSKNGRRVPLIPVEMPMRDDVIQAEFDIDGKSVKIDIGILPNGVTIERGPFWLIYDHRIIESTSIGAGHYSVRRVAGTITIGDGWALAKNKDDLSESHERLADAIFVRIEPILKKADQLAETIDSAALRGELQSMLNSAINQANKVKEKRTKGTSVGSVEPKNKGGTRQRATNVQEGQGSVLSLGARSGRNGGYVFDWCELDKSSIGKFERSGMRVSLNLNNTFVQEIKANNNREAMFAIVWSLIADYECRHDREGTPLLKFSFDDFPSAMGGLSRDFTEGKSNAKDAV